MEAKFSKHSMEKKCLSFIPPTNNLSDLVKVSSDSFYSNQLSHVIKTKTANKKLQTGSHFLLFSWI